MNWWEVDFDNCWVLMSSKDSLDCGWSSNTLALFSHSG